MEREYEIWNGGYIESGAVAIYNYWGKAVGNSFKEACINFSKTDDNFSKNFDEKKLTYYGCKLFDNKNDAEKHYKKFLSKYQPKVDRKRKVNKVIINFLVFFCVLSVVAFVVIMLLFYILRLTAEI